MGTRIYASTPTAIMIKIIVSLHFLIYIIRSSSLDYLLNVADDSLIF